MAPVQRDLLKRMIRDYELQWNYYSLASSHSNKVSPCKPLLLKSSFGEDCHYPVMRKVYQGIIFVTRLNRSATRALVRLRRGVGKDARRRSASIAFRTVGWSSLATLTLRHLYGKHERRPLPSHAQYLLLCHESGAALLSPTHLSIAAVLTARLLSAFTSKQQQQ
jgi:hypothetical protein